MTKPVCVVAGVGPGNGAAFARRFAEADYAVALLARSTDFSEELASGHDRMHAYACDVTDAEQVARTFAAIAADLGQIETLIFNAGSGMFGNVEDITEQAFEQTWRTNALGLLLTSKQVIEPMKSRGRGQILVVGATASLRGGAGFAAFAAAKAAQRSLAQSMARHLGPSGIHVALLIIDGVVDLPRTREMLPDRPDAQFLQPSAIAETAFHLAQQDRSAWTFEIDLRPSTERW